MPLTKAKGLVEVAKAKERSAIRRASNATASKTTKAVMEPLQPCRAKYWASGDVRPEHLIDLLDVSQVAAQRMSRHSTREDSIRTEKVHSSLGSLHEAQGKKSIRSATDRINHYTH